MVYAVPELEDANKSGLSTAIGVNTTLSITTFFARNGYIYPPGSGAMSVFTL
jgi:hypothetical protein